MGASDDEDHQEKTLSQLYDRLPEGCTPLDLLRNKEERDRVGKTETKILTMPNSPHMKLPHLTLVLFLRQSPPSPGHPGPRRGSEDLRLVPPPEQTGGPAGHFESQSQALIRQVQRK